MQIPRDATPPALDAQQFFALVDGLLVSPMAAMGFAAIHGSVNDQPSSRGVLSTGRRAVARDQPFLWFEFGFEADVDDEEWWVSYEPSTGRLELEDWQPVAGDQVDWDISRDDGPCSVPEVRRRLSAVGQAVTAFVEHRDGEGGTPAGGTLACMHDAEAGATRDRGSSAVWISFLAAVAVAEVSGLVVVAFDFWTGYTGYDDSDPSRHLAIGTAFCALLSLVCALLGLRTARRDVFSAWAYTAVALVVATPVLSFFVWARFLA